MALINALPDALFVVDAGGRIVAVNATGLELLGYDESELIGQAVEVLIPERLRAYHAQARRQFVEQPSQRSMAQGRELKALHRDGRELSVQIALSPVRRDETLLVLVALRETPDFVRTLREAEERYRSALEQAPDAVFVADLNGRYIEVNSAACRMLGYSREQLLGKTITDLIPPEDLPRLAETRNRLLQPGVAEVTGWTLLRADGAPLPVEVSAMIHPDGRWQAFARDVSERKRAEAALALALHELETVLETLPDPVAIRIDDLFAYVNPAWLRTLGYSKPSELIGTKVLDSIHPEDHAIFGTRPAAPLTEGATDVVELRMRAKDGSFVPLDFPQSLALHYHGKPARLVVAHDRREEKRVAAALATRERLVTVGTLAAGVGHELNNPLQSVSMNLELLRDELQTVAGSLPSTRYRELLQMTDDALRGTERIRKIVMGLHTFSRGERDEQSQLDPRAVLELSISLARNELRHRVRVELDLEPVPSVMADESKLAQVFINLMINAVHAMPDRPAEDNVIRIATYADSEGRAVIEVADNGSGMMPDVRRRIFEPFFTTKAIGKGTGLGLAISYNIVTSLGGQIECESSPGMGTTFRIVLPPARAATHRSGLRPLVPTPRRGRILVVEDEPVVARLLQRVLSVEHDVDVAADGGDALEGLSQRQDYDAVLCDVMMPRMNGMELFERVLRKYPQLAERFVFMTGGATRPDVDAFLDSVANEKLFKPFSLPSVKAIVSRLLEASRASEVGTSTVKLR
ncbi:MAG: PAS domain S-box protein [Myxococcales bacterium]